MNHSEIHSRYDDGTGADHSIAGQARLAYVSFFGIAAVFGFLLIIAALILRSDLIVYILFGSVTILIMIYILNMYFMQAAITRAADIRVTKVVEFRDSALEIEHQNKWIYAQAALIRETTKAQMLGADPDQQLIGQVKASAPKKVAAIGFNAPAALPYDAPEINDIDVIDGEFNEQSETVPAQRDQ